MNHSVVEQDFCRECCKQTTIVYDYSAGHTTCCECGLVLDCYSIDQTSVEASHLKEDDFFDSTDRLEEQLHKGPIQGGDVSADLKNSIDNTVDRNVSADLKNPILSLDAADRDVSSDLKNPILNLDTVDRNVSTVDLNRTFLERQSTVSQVAAGENPQEEVEEEDVDAKGKGIFVHEIKDKTPFFKRLFAVIDKGSAEAANEVGECSNGNDDKPSASTTDHLKIAIQEIGLGVEQKSEAAELTREEKRMQEQNHEMALTLQKQIQNSTERIKELALAECLQIKKEIEGGLLLADDTLLTEDTAVHSLLIREGLH